MAAVELDENSERGKVDRALRARLGKSARRSRSTLYVNGSRDLIRKVRREFPHRLHHEVPSWVEDGALFHIRIALERGLKQNPLTDPPLARAIIISATLYQQKERWHVTLFVLMPDHLHALLSFPRDESMSSVISDWKRFHARKHQVAWQEGYFDHRLREDERGEQLSMKIDYIRQNPVAAGLCADIADWPWIIDPLE